MMKNNLEFFHIFESLEQPKKKIWIKQKGPKLQMEGIKIRLQTED